MGDALDGAVHTARSWLQAIADGDGETVWTLCAGECRDYVLNIALEQGMAVDLASRLRQGTAAPEERRAYLEQLVAGLQFDLRGVHIGELTYRAYVDPDAPGRVFVEYGSSITLPTHTEFLPAGSIELVEEHDGWRVLRLNPGPRG